MKKVILIFLFFKALSSNGQEDTLYLSSPFNFSEWTGTVDLYATATLNASQFVVAYDEGGLWEGKVRIGNITNDTVITYGSVFSFSTSMSLNGVEVDRLSSTEFLIAYRDNYSLKMRKGEISGEIVIFHPPYTFLNQFCYMYSIAVISPSKFIISYLDPNGDYGKCALGEISNNSISFGTSYTFSSSGIENYAEMTMDTLSESKFVVTYGYWGGYAVIGDINLNNSITFGETYAYNANNQDAYKPKVVSMGENEFIIAYINDYNERNGTLIRGRVLNENEIAYSEKYICSPQNAANISLTAITNNRLILAYDLYDSKGSSYLNTVTLNPESLQVNDAVYNDSLSGYNIVNKFDSNRFILIYYNENNYNGISKIGSTTKFQITTVIPNINETDISVYPNPASQNINIVLKATNKNLTIQIVSMSGTILIEKMASGQLFQLNIESLKKGIYLINIITEQYKITKKIIKN